MFKFIFRFVVSAIHCLFSHNSVSQLQFLQGTEFLLNILFSVITVFMDGFNIFLFRAEERDGNLIDVEDA